MCEVCELPKVQKAPKFEFESANRRSTMASPFLTLDASKQRLDAVHELTDLFSQKYADEESLFGLHEAFEVTVSEAGGGLCCRVTQSVESGTILLTVPGSERITVNTIAQEAANHWESNKGTIQDMFQTLTEKAEEHIKKIQISSADLLCAVAIMYALANETRFDAFIKTWPSREVVMEELISPDEEALRGTWTEQCIRESAKGREFFVNDVLIPTLVKYEVAHLFTKQSTDELAEDFEYAFAIAHFRGFAGAAGNISGEVPPLLDLFSGLPEGSQGINVRTELYMKENETLYSIVAATRNLEPGEELFISYGACPPSTFLCKYGSIPDAYLKEHLMADMIKLQLPSDLLPDLKDSDRVEALSRGDFPITEDELTPIFLSPEDLASYRIGLNGLGDTAPSIKSNEPEEIRTLRQYIILSRVGDDNLIQANLATGRVKGGVDPVEIAKYLLRTIDYNLEQLATQKTNKEELDLLKDTNLTDKEKTCVKARILGRDALAQWRHVICRHYGIFSSADDNEEQRSMFDETLVAFPDPECLHGGGCSVCGRTIGVRSCARCSQVSYCGRDHQVLHWPVHKSKCTPAKEQN
jgi:hypothetical protein